MKEEDLKKTVSETLTQLFEIGFLPKAGDLEYLQIRERLRRYYLLGGDRELYEALESLKSESYFNILPLTYRDKMTIEEIAELMDLERSTVSRNKRKLCLKLWQKLRNLNSQM